MRSLLLRGRAAARPRPLFPPAVAVFVVAAWAISPIASAYPEAPATGPRAVVSDAQYDFGRVRRGEKVVHGFRIHNGGDAPLEFTGATLSRKGMTCRLSAPLAPGADGTISVEWSTEHIFGKLRGEAKILTNDPMNKSIPLELSGEVYGPLDIEPIPAVFISMFQDENVRRELTLRDNQPEPGTIRLLEPQNVHFLAALQPVEPGRLWRLTVRAAPKTPPGRYDETVEVESDDPGIGRVRISVHLFVKSDLYADPDDIDFGQIPLERVRKDPRVLPLLAQTVFVKKRRGDFRLLSLHSDVPALLLTATPASGESDSFEIKVGLRAEALKPASLEGTITIETDDKEFPRFSIRVHGRTVDK